MKRLLSLLLSLVLLLSLLPVAAIPAHAEDSIKFSFVDENGSNVVYVASGTHREITVDVNIDAGDNPISALDVQFKVTMGKIRPLRWVKTRTTRILLFLIRQSRK